MSYFSSQKSNRNALNNIPLNINSSKTADINADKAANNIFENCRGITNIEIPDSVTACG